MDKSTKPAYPVSGGNTVYSTGMTLREHFAAQALAAIDMIDRYGYFDPVSIAKSCYQIADAMIAESEKPQVEDDSC